MISFGKEIVGNNVGGKDGSGVNVKVTEGTGVFEGATVLVAITVVVAAPSVTIMVRQLRPIN